MDNFEFHLPSTDYFDLAAVWDPADSVSLRFGINNLFDEDLPITWIGSGNTRRSPMTPWAAIFSPASTIGHK